MMLTHILLINGPINFLLLAVEAVLMKKVTLYLRILVKILVIVLFFSITSEND